MKCAEFRVDLSALVDDALEAERELRVRHHVRECSSCRQELEQLSSLRRVLATARRLAPPPELALALRVRLSQQAHSHLYDRLTIRLRNLMEPVAVPAVAGLFSAFLLFAILIHGFAIQTPAAQTNDIPLLFSTQPRLKTMAPFTLSTGDHGMSLEIHVDEHGRPVDFRLLEGPADPATLARLRHMLLFTQFRPATEWGIPRHGTAVVNIQSVWVKG